MNEKSRRNQDVPDGSDGHQQANDQQDESARIGRPPEGQNPRRNQHLDDQPQTSTTWHNTTTSHHRRLMSPKCGANKISKNRNQFVQVTEKKKYKGPADPIRSKCATFDDGCSTGRLRPFVRELPTAGGRRSQPPAITTSAPTAAVTST